MLPFFFLLIFAACTCGGAIYGTLLSLSGLACLYSCYYRSKLRAQYDLPEAPCMDCLVHFCCETCALCQEYRELKNRGFDLSIGNTYLTCDWQINILSCHNFRISTFLIILFSQSPYLFSNFNFDALRARILVDCQISYGFAG